MRRALICLLSALAAMSLAAPAFAEDSPPVPPPAPQPTSPAPTPTPAPKPKPKRQKGAISLEVLGGLTAGGTRAYVLSGDLVTVVGHVKPYVRGQRVRIRITGAKGKRTSIRATVRKAKGEGRFTLRFRPKSAANYEIYVRHQRTAKQALFQAREIAQVVEPQLQPGSRGTGVALLKQGLRALGYPAGSGPSWTDKLGRELMAFRKTNNMGRNFTASRTIYKMVFAGKGGFNLVHPEAGKHVEFDWSRQVLALAEGDKVVATYHASSGAPSTPTVFGSYRFYSKWAGTNEKGMYDSNFFIRGYAIHGYPSVPTYPASHGCIRVPNADATDIFAWVAIGDPIFVYV